MSVTREYVASTILRRREVEKLTGLARSTIYQYVKAGDFPPPVRLGARAVGWRYADVLDWINSREASR
jgi:prophage regulatory protein